MLHSIPNTLRPIWYELRRNYAEFRRRGSTATFIAITGSSAKSTTTALISHILSAEASVHVQAVQNSAIDCSKTLSTISHNNRYVVCEIGADGPGSLQPSIDLIKPTVGIVTLVGLEHYSAFRTYDAVASEKSTLIAALPQNGLAILNFDDSRVVSMASRTTAHAATFGESGGDYVISNVESHIPGALRLSITHDETTVNITSRLTGAHQSLAIAAAYTCAHQLGVPPAICQDQIANFEPIFGRCSVHSVENGPVFIADTNKAPYYSIDLVLKMMAQFSAPRKRIVLGQISDAGNTNPKYRDIYRASREIADQVIYVGDNAHRSKATAEEIAAGRFVERRNVHEAATFLKETAVPGEIILLKSAPNLHLERLLLNFLSPVRCWEQHCGKKFQCVECGLFELPFQDHPNKWSRLSWQLDKVRNPTPPAFCNSGHVIAQKG